MDFKMLGKIVFFVGIAVQVVWGFLGNAWAVSWIATFIAVILMIIFNIIDKSKNSGNNQ